MSNGFMKFSMAMKESSKPKFKTVPERQEYFNLKDGNKAVIRVLDHDIYTYRQHMSKKDGMFTNSKCTKNSTSTGGKCVGCEYGDFNKNPTSPFTTRNVDVITIIDKRMVHTIIDGAGKITTQACKITNCPICKSGNTAHIVGRRHWTVGKGHLAVLTDANKEIGNTCLSCKNGEIRVNTLKCKKCGVDLFTEVELMNMNDDSLKAAAIENYTCGSCGHEGMPEEVIECTNCDTPVRSSIYDTDLQIKKIRAEGSSFMSLSVVPTMKYEELPENMTNLQKYKFEEIFPDLPVDIQAAFHKVANPFGVASNVAINSGEAENFLKDT